MLQRVALISIIVLFIIAVITMFFQFRKKDNITKTDTFKAIPINTEVFIYSKDCDKLLDLLIIKEKSIVKAILNLDKSERNSSQLLFIDSIIKKNEDFKEYISDRELTIAISTKGKNKKSSLIILPINNLSDQRTLKNIISNIKAEKNYQLRKKAFNGIDLYTISNPNKKTEFTYCFVDNLFLLSASGLHVEDAVLQLSTETKISNDENFIQLKSTISHGSIFNCFINHKNFPQFLSSYLSKDLSAFIHKNILSSWTTLDIEVNNNHFLLNGFTNSNIAENSFLNIFINQEAKDIHIAEIIPSNCIANVTLMIENAKQFREDYKLYLEKTGDIHTYNKTNYKWNEVGINVESFFDNLLKNEISAIFLEGKEKDQLNNSFFVMKTQGKSFAKQQLEKFFKQYAKAKNTSADNFKKKYWIDKNTQYTFYKFPFKNFAYQYWGRMFKNISINYIALYDNYLIAGYSKEALRQFIYHNLLGKTLPHDEFYKQHKKYISEKNTNLSIYLNLMNGLKWTKELLNEKNKKFITDHIKDLEKFQCISYQLAKTDEFLYNQIYLSYNSNFEVAPETNWQSRLETDISMKPALVTNHLTFDKEILVQDNANKLYLINNSGLIIWKNKLNEKINSDIYQIDYFRNNKLQYLFSTKSQLHLIDRNGNYVDRYPINLKVNASAGMALFDYEEDQNYRIFIPGINRKIYTYDLEGHIVSGWTFSKTDYPVNTPIQHIRIDTKDYIVCADKSRTYILDRKGNERVSLNESYGKSKNNPFIVDYDNKRLISTTPNGLIVFNYFDGSVAIKHINAFSNSHYFIAEDINNDNKKDFIFLDKKMLKIFNSNGDKLFEKTFENHILFPPRLYEMSYNLFKIGITAGNHIYLFDNKGKLHPGFPLQGKANFTIGYLTNNSKQFSLFVAGRENSLYNYIIK